MKTISQRYAERLSAIPVGKNGRPEPRETSRLKSQVRTEFWEDVAFVLDPLDRRMEAGTRGNAFYERDGRMSASAMMASLKEMRRFFGLPCLALGDWFKLRFILAELLQKSQTQDDADVAVCVLVEFVRVEHGEAPDPEYGNFPQRDYSYLNELRDEDLPEDDAEAEALLELDTFDGFSTLDSRNIRFFRAWEDALNDPAMFEKQFPGMSVRRQRLGQAMRPVFSDLDPCLDFLVLEMCLAWIKELMKTPFDVNRFPVVEQADAAA
jgi:hypothetical protein